VSVCPKRKQSRSSTRSTSVHRWPFLAARRVAGRCVKRACGGGPGQLPGLTIHVPLIPLPGGRA